MKVALVTLQYPPDGVGGIGTYAETVAGALAAAGHDVTVVCAARGQRRSSRIERGVRIERSPMLGPRWLWERLIAPDQGFRVRVHHAVTSLWALRRAGRFDAVEAPEWKAQALLLRLARRGPVVTHLHLNLEGQLAWNRVAPSRGQRLSSVLERLAARAGAARTATSHRTRHLPDGRTWLDGASVSIVAPPLRAGPWGSCPPAGGTGPVVLFVGRLEQRKAPEVLVEAAGLLAAEVPGIRVVCVGQALDVDGRSYAEVVRARAAELGVGCEVHPPSADPDELAGHYARARVVAVPSRFEPLSMVVFEAAACARPVVCSDQVGAAEWFDDDLRDGVVPPGDPAALAAALRPHLLDAGHAEAAGARSRAWAAAVTDPARVVADRVRVYEAVAGRGTPRPFWGTRRDTHGHLRYPRTVGG